MDGIQSGTCPKPERADLITALHTKNGRAPLWCEELAIAHEANIKPWEIEDMPAVWYERIKVWLQQTRENSDE